MSRTIITGAGGTIGSALAKLCVDPLLLERCESALFQVVDLGTPCLCDVTDKDRLEDVFARHAEGSVIFHCAAHKHVPMSECNVDEAVKNNFYGTKYAADAAHKYGAALFVLISTDKAVEPVSTMGATKMLAEQYVKFLDGWSETRFCIARLGNIKGSSGSVYETWEKQASEGGPITLTDPDMMRYFIDLDTAARKINSIVSLAQGGEVFIPDMGRSRRMGDLAEEFAAEHGVEIEIIGARPGERHAEMLKRAGERTVLLSDRVLQAIA